MTITISLKDDSGLGDVASAWVAGWINASSNNFAVLQPDGTFVVNTPLATTVPFLKVSTLPNLTLNVATNGNDRLLFVIAPNQPTALTVSSKAPVAYTQYPSLVTPGVAAPGPFDVFEFGMNAQLDLSAVSGFGLNLRFSTSDTEGAGASAGEENPSTDYGVRESVSRAQIAKAFKAFVAQEAEAYPQAAGYSELLYDKALSGGSYTPPLIDKQYFAICDPNDMLASKSQNYTVTTDDPLEAFWDSTLADVFKAGNMLSINLGSAAVPNIYSGSCAPATNPMTNFTTTAFSLSNGVDSYQFYCPIPGLQSAQYVFQQAFGDLTPAGSSGDAGLLQDCIWEAICRGVALAGVAVADISLTGDSGFSTTAWNDASSWYPAGAPTHVYAKFLHCSDAQGNDSRLSGQQPIFYGGAAYGFSMDENPIGPYSGPNVPSKTIGNISSGTVTVTLGAWSSS
ncbi:hypothetical protein [Roseibium sp.]|uniref:hypothetical protein n=1 Tax=Roseibium sp. TaxID=1936156 RepID=UPI003A970568